jgi:hypothetical protein
MPDKYTNSIYVIFALAAISGGLGGCSIASHRLITGRKMRLSFFAAYGIVGAAFGILFCAFGWVMSDSHPSQIIGPSLASGMIGAFLLGSMNWTARIILKQLGIEVQVTMKKAEKEGEFLTGGEKVEQ